MKLLAKCKMYDFPVPVRIPGNNSCGSQDLFLALRGLISKHAKAHICQGVNMVAVSTNNYFIWSIPRNQGFE